jgi:hypothetical protein
MIESEKKARLLTDMKKIEETAEFVEIWDVWRSYK